MVREQEIRTKQHNLLFCKMVLLEDNHLVLELKSGKRTECIPLETFVHEVNRFTNGQFPQLHMTVK
ncbi:MAG: hypothetical protein IKB07_02695 [Lachnospiraceae bacterium]|nr:hypothetical protein [Lachnospiraceae bacterium]